MWWPMMKNFETKFEYLKETLNGFLKERALTKNQIKQGEDLDYYDHIEDINTHGDD
jgi:hypothetical protein